MPQAAALAVTGGGAPWIRARLRDPAAPDFPMIAPLDPDRPGDRQQFAKPVPVEFGRDPLARIGIQRIDAVGDLLPQVEEIGLNPAVMRDAAEAGANGREDALVRLVGDGRAFGWIMLLRESRIVSGLLQWAGLAAGPVERLYNFVTVVVGLFYTVAAMSCSPGNKSSPICLSKGARLSATASSGRKSGA